MHTNSKSEPANWQEIKGKLIHRHKTISNAASLLDCHPNAIRKAVEGKAPKVWERLTDLLARPIKKVAR